MAMLVRFAMPLLVVLGLMGFALSPLVNHLVGRWFQYDVELRSNLIFNAVQDSLIGMVQAGEGPEIDTLFQRITLDERVQALALCAPAGTPTRASPGWPIQVGCPPAGAPLRKPQFRTDRIAGGALLVATFPLAVQGKTLGSLLILQDVSFIERRSSDTQLYLAAVLVLIGVAAAGVTVVVARLTLRRWLSSVRQSLNPALAAGSRPDPAPEMRPVIAEIRQMLRDLDLSRHTAAGIRVEWSPETLRRVLDNELPGAEVIVVSNREPYIHNDDGHGGIVVQRPASGLVTALEPITRACGGTWIAHGSGSADRRVVDRHDHIPVPPERPTYTLRRIWLSEDEEEGYYYGLANEGLWPLCHISFTRPVLRESDWEHYVAVNRRFADAVLQEAKTDDPIVLVHDYHFALVPRMVRQRLPNAVIITFWHIPWPNAEVFSIFPWREAVLDGLLGSSIIGFHTRFHCNNFIDTVDRFLECHIDREHSTVSVGGHAALVHPYPISIEWPPSPLQGQAPAPECRLSVRTRHGLPAETLLGVGVERFDFTKGIPDRFRAVEMLLENHPELIGRFVYLQVAAPTRSKLPAYRELQAEATAMAEAINARFGRDGYTPILLVARHHEPSDVYELFRAAEVCIVSSLHDGMNLVAKEFVAARDDERGVLILSTFAGASRELLEALIVNPYDTRSMAEAIRQALTMPVEQQQERMRLMRDLVRENNVYHWAGRMLLDGARLRKRGRIEAHIDAMGAG
ncbi:alpha,alpha-trehalose-phosphate synthase (UDP-forming) [Azospirillum sp.]|uniref:alpha,alpha-trehalose-phosphate synthase (UDP-forming) n=1 Tax=Azospirillum sp. TaxID=34012 RepID=UPI003D76202D